MKIFDMKTSFAAGELSPLLHARVDLAQYANGVGKLENFIILPQGGLINRPGTAPMTGVAGYMAVRLVPFVFSEEDSLCLAFGDGFVDVYGPSGFILRKDGSPYGAAHLPKLRWLQSADVLYLFHPTVPVHTLSRYGPTDWRFEPVAFKNGPFSDTNTDEIRKIRVSYGAAAANWDFFRPNMAGSLLKLEVKVKSEAHRLSLSTLTSNSNPVSTKTIYNVFGPYTYRTMGKWIGEILVERCVAEDWLGKTEANWTWREFKRYTSVSGAEENFAFSGAVEEYSTHFRFTLITNSRVEITFDFEGGLIERIYQINSVANGSFAWVANHGKKGGDYCPETDAWALGAFGSAGGYPSLGVFHQERLILAATPAAPQSIWMSQPASWHDFGTSIPTKDDDSITVTLASKQVNAIRGLASRGDLLIFTSGGEWSAKAGAKTDAFTPSSIVITPSGYRGSSDLSPLDVGTSSLFVQRDGKTVRALGYSLEMDNYISSDLSILAEHLFRNSSVKRWGYQQTPWSIVWVVMGDGRLLALTLNQEHQVNGWARHNLRGKVHDVCCVPGAGQDEVYFAVTRGEQIKIEKLKRWNEASLDVFMEADGTAVLSEVELLEWEQQINGTLQGRHKGIVVLTLRLFATVLSGLKAGVLNENNQTLLPVRVPAWTDPDTPYTGDIRTELTGGMGRRCRVRLENTEAGPLALLGIFPEVDVYE